jgi:hypothetical protein
MGCGTGQKPTDRPALCSRLPLRECRTQDRASGLVTEATYLCHVVVCWGRSEGRGAPKQEYVEELTGQAVATRPKTPS